MSGKLKKFFSDRQFVHSSAGGNEPRREITVHNLFMNKGSCDKQLDFSFFSIDSFKNMTTMSHGHKFFFQKAPRTATAIVLLFSFICH